MNDGFKKTMIYATLGSFIVTMPVVPFGDCSPKQMCAIASDEQLHTQEREPAQTQTFQQIVAVSTASSAGTYFAVMPK